MNPEVLPGVLTHTYEEYIARIELIEKSDLVWAHIDIMDGRFVPNLTVGLHDIAGVPTKLRLEIHAMVSDPVSLASEYAAVGCRRLLIHREAFHSEAELRDGVMQLRQYVPEVGLVYNLETPFDDILSELPLASVQCMAVPPGRSGQQLDERVYHRLRELTALGIGAVRAVDGGVSEETLPMLQAAGAERFVVSSHLFAGSSVSYNYNRLTQVMQEGSV
jgi:ribulose-phosphate 3-epimerase